nr:MAG TPA: hypothetical protein [Caudoviricetes sp.]
MRPFSGQPGFKVCLCHFCHNGNESCCCVRRGRISSD